MYNSDNIVEDPSSEKGVINSGFGQSIHDVRSAMNLFVVGEHSTFGLVEYFVLPAFWKNIRNYPLR